MEKWLVSYTRVPTNFNDEQVALVEAKTETDAERLVSRRLGEHLTRLTGYVITARAYEEPEPVEGQIKTMNHNE